MSKKSANIIALISETLGNAYHHRLVIIKAPTNLNASKTLSPSTSCLKHQPTLIAIDTKSEMFSHHLSISHVRKRRLTLISIMSETLGNFYCQRVFVFETPGNTYDYPLVMCEIPANSYGHRLIMSKTPTNFSKY